jgi:hypothetical protein
MDANAVWQTEPHCAFRLEGSEIPKSSAISKTGSLPDEGKMPAMISVPGCHP